MAHYFESGFFVREKAWHGLGTVLKEAPSTSEALRLAGLDWHVNLAPVYCMPGMPHDYVPSKDARFNAGELLPADDARAMVRDVHTPDGDVQTSVLGIVGNRYVPLQNVDAFRWFDPLVAEGNCSLEAAGSLQHGRKVWILAKINDAVERVGSNAEDIVAPYLLLSNSHDGTRAVTVAFTPIRVVCWNTLSAAHRHADAHGDTQRKVRHTRSAKDTLAEVRETIDLARRDFSAKALLWREMARVPIANPRIVRDYFREVFATEQAVEAAHANREPLPELRSEKVLIDLFRAGPGADSAGATVFGAYMAATHFIDHEQGRNPDTRLTASWFGRGALLRKRAEDKALALAGIAP